MIYVINETAATTGFLFISLMYKCLLPWKQVDHIRRKVSLSLVPSCRSRACISSLNCGTVSYHVITTCPTGELLTQSLPNVTEGNQVVGRPPLVSKTLFMAEIFQGAQNEARPFSWREQKPCLHSQRVEEEIKCLGSL
jgi:hypothetical protein